jgi:ankyrin repeat protein
VLLEKGADVNAQGGPYGNNALQAASAAGHKQVVQVLLEKGADVNAQGGPYGNALQAASARGHEQVVQVLLEKEQILKVKTMAMHPAPRIKRVEFLPSFSPA